MKKKKIGLIILANLITILLVGIYTTVGDETGGPCGGPCCGLPEGGEGGGYSDYGMIMGDFLIFDGESAWCDKDGKCYALFDSRDITDTLKGIASDIMSIRGGRGSQDISAFGYATGARN